MNSAAAPSPAVMILPRAEIAAMMTASDYLSAVETGFMALHEGRAEVPAPWYIDGDGGGFHGKGASLRLERLYLAFKLNGNFPGNRGTNGLPTIQGSILLCDGATGSPLAIMDSIEITLRRTAAATALAARYLARKESTTILVCGCGEQASPHLEALREVLPLQRCLAWDRDPARAAGLPHHGLELVVASDLHEAAIQADVIVTCTTATMPFLTTASVRPGTFVAAVGADAPHKSEIDPALMKSALIVTDLTAQCAVMGDLHHAIDASAMTTDGVHAELAELVAGTRSGRTDETQITLFDSTGTAVQDVAAAAHIYRLAQTTGAAQTVWLAA